MTCFNAAHDSEGSLTIDTFYDDEGNAKDDASNDLIWNYHVWNEVSKLYFVKSMYLLKTTEKADYVIRQRNTFNNRIERS